MQKRNYIVGMVQQVQTGNHEKPFLACWSYQRQQSLERDGWAILTIRFDGLEPNHARTIAAFAGGREI